MEALGALEARTIGPRKDATHRLNPRSRTSTSISTRSRHHSSSKQSPVSGPWVWRLSVVGSWGWAWQEFRRGFTYNGTMLRPAMVGVAAPLEVEEEAAEGDAKEAAEASTEK